MKVQINLGEKDQGKLDWNLRVEVGTARLHNQLTGAQAGFRTTEAGSPETAGKHSFFHSHVCKLHVRSKGGSRCGEHSEGTGNSELG